MFENIFETVNSGLAQALYEDWLGDPESVPPEWRALFDAGLKGEPPASTPSRNGDSRDETADSALPGEPITGPRLRLLQNMEASLTVPTATSFRDVDVSKLWEQRAALNRSLAEAGLKLSFTHLIAWALVKAASRYPSMVCSVVEEGDARFRQVPEHISLGLAVDVERKDGSRGLLVPVISRADEMTFREFHVEYERLVAGARTGKLMPDAYQGAAMTLTNPGTLGTVASVPRLMVGQGSIIATGVIRTVGSQRVMTLTSTYDHRVIQGAESGLFLQWVDQLLQGEEGFYAAIATAMQVPEPGTNAPTVAAHDPPTIATGRDTPLAFVAAAMSLVKAHRTHGYLAAHLDPLGTPPIGDPAIDPGPAELTPEVIATIPARVLRTYVPGETLADALPALRETYCGHIAYEIEHIAPHEERVWLRKVIESGEHRSALSAEERLKILDQLVKVEGLESFLHKSYLGHKRFGIEGLDMLVPMLHFAIDAAVQHGAEEIAIGMAHRGRLNVLSHVLGVSYETLLAEFEGGRQVEETLAPEGGTGDVKYHHGAYMSYDSVHGPVQITLLPNPSHLEAVNPVVEGYTRAVQTARDGGTGVHNSDRALPVLIHGDAAFAGQGIVAETFNLANLNGYNTGGTLHIITNNQVGFTTAPVEARSTDFASDLAKGFDVPIIHVNADHPEECIAAVRLAMMYRETYGKDCVIDLVGYRRHGHNEGDEPRYTQPAMYRTIDAHPSVLTLYGRRLVEEGILSEDELVGRQRDLAVALGAVQEDLRRDVSGFEGGEEPFRTGHDPTVEPDTAVPSDILNQVNDQLLATPEAFTVHPKLARQLARRGQDLGPDAFLDWAHAEALALGTLVVEGYPVRLTGQDTERGTFSQRHLVLHDASSATRYAPIQHLGRASASFELHNSPLSEYAALGFEYGYSVRAPTALVIWEAQFGDFANGAQIIVDQFICAGLAKWGQTSRLTLLLPHGYEGQGPEHSSARLERFLALGAEDNIRVANCSTPAQYFHLLRRQAMHGERRPLVVMTPKSLLRLPQAASPFSELVTNRFQPVLDDPERSAASDAVRRLVLCTGKVYYDLAQDTRRAEAHHVALARIEMLYPFPAEAVSALLDRYPKLEEVVWVQEEPENFGARKWMVPQIIALTGIRVRYISRPERSSPAEGYPAAHREEQLRIVTEALS